MRPKRQIRHDGARAVFAAASLCAATACTQPSYGTTQTTAVRVVAHPHAGQALLVETASCWMGGVWGDVESSSCDRVVRSVFGRPDHERYLRLRSFDPETLYAVRTAIARRALEDPNEARNTGVLEDVFEKLGAAERETQLAHRAAHRIQRDFDQAQYVLPDLESATAFADLHRIDAGELGAEARVVSLIALLDRLMVASELPMPLRPYAVAEPLRVVFGGRPPMLPNDLSRPVDRVAWLLYLSDAARQARHPVPDENLPLPARHQAAVAGILDGIADQLRQSATAISPDSPLARVTQLTIRAVERSRERPIF